MRYLKTFESLEGEKIDNLKKLLSHFIKVFSGHGLDYSSYYERGSYETEFELKENDKTYYLFAVIMVGRYHRLFFTIKESLANENHELVKFIPDYLKTIKGLKYLGYINHDHDFEITTNVDDVINQITLEDFELKLNAYKYNL